MLAPQQTLLLRVYNTTAVHFQPAELISVWKKKQNSLTFYSLQAVFDFRINTLKHETRVHIMLTSPCNEHPKNLTLYRVRWGLQGYTLFFLFWHKNSDCGYLLEHKQSTGSNLAQVRKKWHLLLKKIGRSFMRQGWSRMNHGCMQMSRNGVLKI